MKRYQSNILKIAVPLVATLVGAPAGADSRATKSESIVGSWSGDFGAGNWTFVFEGAGNSWSGRYTYPQYKGWNPVIGLAASDRSARFSLKARTTVDFNLKLQPSNNVLSGTVRFGHGMSSSSPPVTLPVQLKRM